jgi:hypothetical protein
LENLLNITNSYVITICGDARKGKSTFLNIIINFLTQHNEEYFNVSSSIKHCTLGVDYVELKTKNIKYIFIDCQGLNFENSSYDCKLLLFLYTISNIFIYNDKNIINNNMFSTLQPMAMFINIFTSMETKPILYFRIADYDLDGEPQELIENLFIPQNDQYDNVRISINKLFDSIFIIATEPFTKQNKKNIKEKKYNLFLQENKYLEPMFINLFALLEEQPVKNINLEKLINDINSNNKIDYQKLDIYSLNTKIEIKEFIENYIDNNTDFYHIMSDGTNSTRIKIDEYNKNIKKIKVLFEDHFSSVPNELKLIFSKSIDTLNEKYTTFSTTNEKIATEQIDKIYNRIVNYNLLIIKNYYSILDKHYDYTFIISKINTLEQLKEQICNYDYIVVNFYIKKYTEYLFELKNDINNIEIINKNTWIKFMTEIENAYTPKYINTIIDNIIDYKNTFNGNYDEFIIATHPYININIDSYLKFNNNVVKYEEYNTDISTIKQKYIDKFYESSQQKKFIDYFYEKVRKVINNQGLILDELCINNKEIYLIGIKLDFPFYIHISIEITKFYEMMKFFNMNTIIISKWINYIINHPHLFSGNIIKGICIDNNKNNCIIRTILNNFIIKLTEDILENKNTTFITKQQLEYFNELEYKFE